LFHYWDIKVQGHRSVESAASPEANRIHKGTPMQISVYTMTVETFLPMLANL
jgi:hypothetical protein